MNLTKLTQIIQEIDTSEVQKLKDILACSGQIVLIGNGGSNSIAAHMAVDYSKFLGKKCIANDSSPMLTMLINDYGMEEAYARFVRYHTAPNTVVIIISSSGNSENCVQAALCTVELGMDLVILSGFDTDNKLNQIESDRIKLKYWVDSHDYGVVEMAHHVFLHAAV